MVPRRRLIVTGASTEVNRDIIRRHFGHWFACETTKTNVRGEGIYINRRRGHTESSHSIIRFSLLGVWIHWTTQRFIYTDQLGNTARQICGAKMNHLMHIVLNLIISHIVFSKTQIFGPVTSSSMIHHFEKKKHKKMRKTFSNSALF